MTKKELRKQIEIEVAEFRLTNPVTKLRPQKNPKTITAIAPSNSNYISRLNRK